MPDANSFKDMAEFLQMYGGWAVSVLLMVAIAYLYRTMGCLLENRNVQLINLLTECKIVVAENKIFMDRVEVAMADAANGVKANTTMFNEVALFLRRSSEVMDQVRIQMEIANRRQV